MAAHCLTASSDMSQSSSHLHCERYFINYIGVCMLYVGVIPEDKDDRHPRTVNLLNTHLWHLTDPSDVLWSTVTLIKGNKKKFKRKHRRRIRVNFIDTCWQFDQQEALQRPTGQQVGHDAPERQADSWLVHLLPDSHSQECSRPLTSQCSSGM